MSESVCFVPDGNPFLIEMDFLDLTTLPKDTAWIVSNPPYSKTLCRPLIEHGLSLLPAGGQLHALLPSLWFHAKTRQSLWGHVTHVTFLGRCQMLPPHAPDLGKRGKVDFSWFTLSKTPRVGDLVSVRHLGSAMA